MPELPEVEIVRRGLEPVLEGAYIRALKTQRPGLRFPFPPNLAEIAEGQRVLTVGRRAKFLLFELSNGRTLVSHLGMSGSWRIEAAGQGAGAPNPAAPALQKHDHIEILAERPDKAFSYIIYNDPRRFGFLLAAETAALADFPPLAKLGIEPLGNQLSGPFLLAAFKGKKAPLKTALLDQSIIAGLGNIYANESLWRAELSPFRPAGDLTAAQAEALAAAIRSVLEDALKSGGSHLRNCIKADGTLGLFQHHFQVYGREGEPCRRCGAPIKRAVIGGRSSFYCENCQK